MTTTFDGPALAQDSEIYDPNEGLFCNSPPMKALQPKLDLSPSPPPAIPLPRVSLPPKSGRKSSNRRRKVPPSQGDAVLIQYMDGGKRPDIAFEAGSRPLSSSVGEGGEEGEEGDEEEEGSCSSSSASSSEHEFDDQTLSPAMSPESRPIIPPAIDLKSLAASALSIQAPAPEEPRDVEQTNEMGLVRQETFSSRHGDRPTSLRQQQQPPHPLPLRGEPISQTPKPVLAPPMSPLHLPGDSGLILPAPSINMHGDLPPIGSPQSETNGHASLPPIRSQLGEQLSDHPSMTEKEHAMRHGPPTPSFLNSPPATSRMPPLSNPHASPPVSPNYAYSQSMPSPAHSLPMLSPFAFSPPSTGRLRSGSEFSSNNGDRPNLSDQQIPTPASSITDRMSIDNMTNPTGNFICKFAGCNAAPFQTQYLLNSHANVHSSARPHYCAVKGCPRSEGGKGFKRKNEMIRHGLVHESPGYVCPFCPDREHKYPRPDNLQSRMNGGNDANTKFSSLSGM
ncbi:C2H2 type zinc finger domain-containing protein [Apiospora aurea]|uniref:C2H2 type zinc finger domain-containing protein n=1 Tax=Apiospora aurea TaxID=335848 RepID=A0ABR1PU14_9PEZI